MTAFKVDESSLLDRLFELFRASGFEGASLAAISEATGLGRASLYHRFPGGKEDMARAAMEHAHRRFGAEVLGSGALVEQDPLREARRLSRALAAFYRDGTAPCMLDSMTLAGGPDLRPLAAASLRALQDRCEAIARAAGAASADARRRAEEASARVQGALVVSRISGDPGVFTRMIKELPEVLAAPG